MKQLSYKKFNVLIGIGISLFSCFAFGDETRLSIIQNAGHSEISWTTQTDLYYYLQISTDLDFSPESLFPYATRGDGNARQLGVIHSGKMFYRLMLLDDPTDPFLHMDRDADTFADLYELNLGSNPFEYVDVDVNGIPDDIQFFWEAIPNDWKDAVVEVGLLG